MRLTCPLCGDRDLREFTYYGSEDYLTRPAPQDAAGWDDHLHNRANPAGATRDLWYHEWGCAAWLRVSRNTVTHEVSATELLAGRGGVPAGGAAADGVVADGAGGAA